MYFDSTLIFGALLFCFPIISPPHVVGEESEVDVNLINEIFGARGAYSGVTGVTPAVDTAADFGILDILLQKERSKDNVIEEETVTECHCDKNETESTEPSVKKIRVISNEALQDACSAYSKSHGFKCVPYYQCDESGIILSDGAGLIDIRFGGDTPTTAKLDASDKKCPSFLDVCCTDPDWKPSTSTITSVEETTVESFDCLSYKSTNFFDCVPYDQCDNGVVLDDSWHTLINPRFGDYDKSRSTTPPPLVDLTLLFELKCADPSHFCCFNPALEHEKDLKDSLPSSTSSTTEEDHEDGVDATSIPAEGIDTTTLSMNVDADETGGSESSTNSSNGNGGDDDTSTTDDKPDTNTDIDVTVPAESPMTTLPPDSGDAVLLTQPPPTDDDNITEDDTDPIYEGSVEEDQGSTESETETAAVDSEESGSSDFEQTVTDVISEEISTEPAVVVDNEDVTRDDVTTSPPVEVVSSTTEVIPESTSHKADERTATSASVVSPPLKCGLHNTRGVGVEISNYKEGEAQFGEWPHMCAIIRVMKNPNKAGSGYSSEETINVFQCGASLIAPGIALTAGHCAKKIDSSETAYVRCGEWDTQTSNEPRSHVDRRVVTIEIHQEFNKKNLQNDFALLFTDEDFPISEHINPVCLTKESDQLSPEASVIDISNCFVTGWGKDKFGKEGEFQVILKEISMPIIPNPKCEQNLRKLTSLPNRFRLHSSFICAGGTKESQDACQGDGGGPLVCPIAKNDDESPQQERVVQVGIVAWGIDCGKEGVPGVYASIDEGLCWIDWTASCKVGTPSSKDTGTGAIVNSFFGLNKSKKYGPKCKEWLDGKRGNGEVTSQRQFLPAVIRDRYKTGCTVDWQYTKDDGDQVTTSIGGGSGDIY